GRLRLVRRLRVREPDVASRQPHLDLTAGELAVHLQRRLRQDGQEPRAHGGVKRPAELLSHPQGDLVSDAGCRDQVGAESFDVSGNVHDVIMTSLWRLSSVTVT